MVLPLLTDNVLHLKINLNRKGVYKCMYHQDTLSCRLMIDFVVKERFYTHTSRGTLITVQLRQRTLSPSEPCSMPQLLRWLLSAVTTRLMVLLVMAILKLGGGDSEAIRRKK